MAEILTWLFPVSFLCFGIGIGLIIRRRQKDRAELEARRPAPPQRAVNPQSEEPLYYSAPGFRRDGEP